jgi:hypothetical protein
VVRDGGRVASSIGKAREAVPQERGLTVHAANMVDRGRLPEVLAPLAEGQIKAPQIRLIELGQVADALAEAGQKHGVGKTVIRIA